MTLYKHLVTVTVVTAECSPDRVERQLERAFVSDAAPEVSVTAEVTNRAEAPYIRVPNRPKREHCVTDAEYFDLCDEWSDGLPRAHNFDDPSFDGGCL